MNYSKPLLAAALLLGLGAMSQGAYAVPAAPFNECPAINTSPSCSFLFQVTDSGIHSFYDSTVPPYDKSDDSLIGVINDSIAAVNSLTLSGTAGSAGIFAFDSDGLQTYTSVDTSNFPPGYQTTGYEGPNTYFSDIGVKQIYGDVGVVNFIGGLAPGATTYFSLDGNPSIIASNGGISPGETPGLPEPGTLTLLALGLSLGGVMRSAHHVGRTK